MKFGVREIANVVFRAKHEQQIGSTIFKQGQPVFYLDSAKTSSMEGGATTVYATGGRGNTRLVTWEGERTLTFTVEDALLSPISFGMLSGAGIIKGSANSEQLVHFHQYTRAMTGSDGKIDLTQVVKEGESICSTAPLYVLELDEDGEITGKVLTSYRPYKYSAPIPQDGDPDPTPEEQAAEAAKQKLTGRILEEVTYGQNDVASLASNNKGKNVMVDYYVLKKDKNVTQLSIDAKHFGGYFYVEADTLFRTKDGKDLPANLTFPNVKIQSNFTFSMSSSGDPSTFTFTMDAMPGYTYFNKTDEVLCAMQIVDDTVTVTNDAKRLFLHPANLQIEESRNDSSSKNYNDVQG